METKTSDGGIEYAQPSAWMLSPILSTEECAALLRCSTDRIEQLAAEGILPGCKFGRSWVFHRDLLIAAVGERCAAAYQKRQSRSDRASKAGVPVVDLDARPGGSEPSLSSLPVIEPKTKRPRGRPRINVVIPD